MLVDSIQLLWMLIVLVFVDLVSDNAARASLINGATRWLVLVILAVVAALALFVVLPYWRTTYELSNQGITLNQGVLRRQHRHVTYARIQTVQHLQWFFMKPLHLEKVQIETAARGGGSGEIVLTLVPIAVGQEIEARHQAARAANQTANIEVPVAQEMPTTPAVRATTYQLPMDELMLFGITSLGFVPLLLLLIAVGSRVSDFFPGLVDWASRLVTRLPVLAVIVVGLLALVGGIIIEFARILIRYWGFTLSFDGQQLHSRKGLLQTSTVTAHARRIQAVRYKQNIIRQWLHVGTAQVILAANVANNEDDKDMVIYPLAHQDKVWMLLSKYVNWLPAPLRALHVVSTGYWALIRNAMILPAIVVLPCLIWLRPWGWFSLALLVWGGVQGRYAATRRGYAIQGHFAWLQTGRWFERELLVVPRIRVQSLTVRQSWWMVRTGLAHVRVILRRGDGDYQVDLRYVPLAVGDALYRWYIGN
ncbi:hypothetical protein FD19_GL001716 [Lacticaseibacillus thailandensis DSM 22698 = JCM 13996]|uniref:YdbS-like PH domain-containing protein n=2 Tax=Lacticaseibacillus thailandensis TaxID=381741 RepID=A0A0R2C4Z5_9LACO|nr:hypothetical protein FD19_GL001716 [Lacticaseibacillus thailandensis DSM 22698 = JCM 13996]